MYNSWHGQRWRATRAKWKAQANQVVSPPPNLDRLWGDPSYSIIGRKSMAGSKKFFVYTTDQGDDFALLADESNTEAVNGSTQDFIAGLSILYTIPGNVRPRAAVYQNADKTRTIRCYALTPTIYNGVIANAPTITDPIAGTGTLSLSRLEPEKIKLLPTAADSGLNDGDAT